MTTTACRLSLAALLALALLATPGRADTISYDVAADYYHQGAFSQFDPALGTLTEVDLSARGTTLEGVRFIRQGFQPVHATLTATLSYGFFGGPLSVDLASAPGSTSTTHVFAPGERSWTWDASIPSAVAATLAAPDVLAGFVGAGTLHFGLMPTTSLVSDGIADPFPPVGIGTADITYVYTPAVPEPASAAMLALGLAGVAMVAARGARRA